MPDIGEFARKSSEVAAEEEGLESGLHPTRQRASHAGDLPVHASPRSIWTSKLVMSLVAPTVVLW